MVSALVGDFELKRRRSPAAAAPMRSGGSLITTRHRVGCRSRKNGAPRRKTRRVSLINSKNDTQRACRLAKDGPVLDDGGQLAAGFRAAAQSADGTETMIEQRPAAEDKAGEARGSCQGEATASDRRRRPRPASGGCERPLRRSYHLRERMHRRHGSRRPDDRRGRRAFGPVSRQDLPKIRESRGRPTGVSRTGNAAGDRERPQDRLLPDLLDAWAEADRSPLRDRRRRVTFDACAATGVQGKET